MKACQFTVTIDASAGWNAHDSRTRSVRDEVDSLYITLAEHVDPAVGAYDGVHDGSEAGKKPLVLRQKRICVRRQDEAA